MLRANSVQVRAKGAVVTGMPPTATGHPIHIDVSALNRVAVHSVDVLLARGTNPVVHSRQIAALLDHPATQVQAFRRLEHLAGGIGLVLARPRRWSRRREGLPWY